MRWTLALALVACSSSPSAPPPETFTFGPYHLAPSQEITDQCVSATLHNETELAINAVELMTATGFHHSNWFFVPDNRYDGLATVSGLVTDTAGSNTKWGGTVGAGIEYGFAPNWSFAVEYDHLFMGTDNYAFNTAGLPTRNENIKQDADLVTVRVNYRFGGPVVGRY